MDVRRFWLPMTVGLLTGCAGMAAQTPGEWTVRPEWVEAHEQFLASDVLRGRGSATHDEEVAATYVASEFMGYGLSRAPGMTSYIQTAELISPELNEHAALAAGAVQTEEGPGFTLLQSSGMSVGGPLVKIRAGDARSAKVPRGAAVLLTNVPPGQSLSALAPLRRSGAAVFLIPCDDSTSQMYTALGGKPRVPVRLKGTAPGREGPAVVALNAAPFAQMEELPDGTPANLTVTLIPQTKPRVTSNVIGYLPGSDPAAGTILLTAHLDHLGMGRAVHGDSIYNGANDDAAGTTAVLELARALGQSPRLRRSVLFVCYGSEEVGELGSTYFGEHSPVPLKDLVANLEFEMIGNQDPRMPKDTLLFTGWERSNLGPELKAHGALLGPDPYPEQHFFERSDNYSLALKGVVAHTAAGWGTVPTYHQPDDDLEHLDLPFMTAAIQSLVGPVRWLAESDFVPRWNPGGKPTGEDEE